jgi:transposase-like protein
MMFLTVYLGGDFSMAKKGQTFNTYTEELKTEVVRLKLEEGWSYRQLRERFGIKSDAQIAEWVKKVKTGESFDDQRGVWTRKNFSSIEEENAYLKAQVEYLKKRNPNLHGREWS